MIGFVRQQQKAGNDPEGCRLPCDSPDNIVAPGKIKE